MTMLVDQVVDAFIAVIGATDGVAGRVSEDRSVPYEKADAPAIDVRLVDADSRTLGDNGPLGSVLRVQLQVDMAIYTRSAITAEGTELSARKLASAVWESAHRLLMTAPSLSGLAQRLRWQRSAWSKDSADGTAGWAVHTYSITLVAQERTLRAPAF